MDKIEKGLCHLCDVTNYNDNEGKEQMVVVHTNGKKFCKYHYEIVKEYEAETKGLSKEETLKSLINEGKRIGLKSGYKNN